MVTLTVPPQQQAAAGGSTVNDDLSGDAHRRLIGYIGLLLPVILIVLAGLFPHGSDSPWTPLPSLSAYFYTAANAAFVGMLVALALFLFTYRGYANAYHRYDRALAVIAGVAALGVAVFPTALPDGGHGLVDMPWFARWMGWVHLCSAVVLFLSFAAFSLWLFRLSGPKHAISPSKRRRNNLYLACGLVILGGIIWTVVAHLRGQSIFLPETVTVVAFAVSWLVKGDAYGSVSNVLKHDDGSKPAPGH